jgi:hypothetical protein
MPEAIEQRVYQLCGRQCPCYIYDTRAIDQADGASPVLISVPSSTGYTVFEQLHHPRVLVALDVSRRAMAVKFLHIALTHYTKIRSCMFSLWMRKMRVSLIDVRGKCLADDISVRS